MRITTQMLNETSRKAGVPVHTTSMLSYVFNKDKTNALPFERNLGGEMETSQRQRNYEKQEDMAKHLKTIAEELAADGDKSIYDSDGTSESKEALEKKVEELVKHYNEVLNTFSGSSDLLDTFYRNNLKSLVEEHEKQLEAIGITADKNGKLMVNEHKLAAAEQSAVRQALAGKDGFADTLAFLSGKIADYAASNQKSVGNLYRQDGSESSALPYTKNRYNAWG